MSRHSLDSDITQVHPDTFFGAVGTAAKCLLNAAMLRETTSTNLRGPVLAQIMDIVDISVSKYSTQEALETQVDLRAASTDRLRRKIAVPGEESNDDESTGHISGDPNSGTHSRENHTYKFTLQDTKGDCVYAINVTKIAGLDSSTKLGAKIILSNVPCQRGVLLLTSSSVQLLGGSIKELENIRVKTMLDRLNKELST